MAEFDYIIVGSGMNSLVCAAILVQKNNKVLVLERESVAGGCIKSGEVTVAGYNHDLMSGFYPEFLAGAAYAHLADDLHKHGLEFLNTDLPMACMLPGGRHFILTRDRAENIARLNQLADGDGHVFDQDMTEFASQAHISFGLLGNEVLSWGTYRILFKEFFKNGLSSLTKFFGEATRSARHWVSAYQSEEARACFAPWVLHAGMDIDGAMSGYMGRVFIFAIEAAGMPVVKGGSHKIISAFEGMLNEYGSEVRTGVDVANLVVSGRKATGIKDMDGNFIACNKGVICNVTPTALYGPNGLLDSKLIPKPIKESVKNYQYGRGNMIIHLALNGVPHWPDETLGKVAMIHVCDSLAQTTQSLADVKNGLLPARATLAIGQKSTVDPSRVPEGGFSLWVQLHEIPREVKGDAAGELDVSKGWTHELGEQYADRIMDQLEEYAPGLNKMVMGRNVFTPKDLEMMNKNLVGGDPYSGQNTMDQFLLWRPLKTTKGHKTPIKNVFHIGASTHPGPGLGGGSGYLVGSALK